MSWTLSFQSTRPRGARLAGWCGAVAGMALLFQSTRPRGARLASSCSASRSDRFNPRARAGRDGIPTAGRACCSSFNPRARAGRDSPAWALACASSLCFNPRARAGRDAQRGGDVVVGQRFQSTRPRGARPPVWYLPRSRRPFQSTRPRGARRWTLGIPTSTRRFQSTRPRGARPAATDRPAAASRGFNPRARAGRDQINASGVGVHAEFQSTRPRGARLFGGRGWVDPVKVSIHAPARGATSVTQPNNHTDLFQSTRPRGARLPASAPERRLRRRFNPRARAGRDVGLHRCSRLLAGGFNPRARAGRDKVVGG